MQTKLTKDQEFVREELSKVFPQLKINADKVCGWGKDRWADDLLQLSVEMFLEKPIDQQLYTIEIGKLENFITTIMNAQLKLGRTTRFYHTHRKFITSTREYYMNRGYNEVGTLKQPFDDEPDRCMECIKKEISKLNPFQKMIVKEKIEYGYRYTDIAKKYGIPYNQLQSELKLVLKEINQTCKHLR
tara:strand:- start:499 stop:1059 length:561 start_codon:yes stop_codon:yes gene_type:complete